MAVARDAIGTAAAGTDGEATETAGSTGAVIAATGTGGTEAAEGAIGGRGDTENHGRDRRYVIPIIRKHNRRQSDKNLPCD